MTDNVKETGRGLAKHILVYILDALIVCFAALAALWLITWGADFGFVRDTSVWGWIFLWKKRNHVRLYL